MLINVNDVVLEVLLLVADLTPPGVLALLLADLVVLLLAHILGHNLAFSLGLSWIVLGRVLVQTHLRT